MSKLANYKLNTTFDGPDKVTHTTYISDMATGVRRKPLQTTWTTTKIIGQGGFGSVLLQKADNSQLRAVKKIEKKPSGIGVEITVMLKVASHQILFVVLDGWYENDDFYFISMEYIPGGDLDVYLTTHSPLRAEIARDITQQLLEGLAVLHEMRICHRDIKPQNILIASENPIWVKISDFGISKHFKHLPLQTRVGSMAYMAPEQMGMLPNEPKGEVYTTAVDLWSLGCVVHQMLTTEMPFLEAVSDELTSDGMVTGSAAGNTVQSMDPPERQPDYVALQDFCWGKREFPDDDLRRSEVGDLAVSFLMTLLVPDPKSRVLAKEALKSNWILQEGDSRDFGGERATEGIRESAPAMATANPIIINHHNALDEIHKFTQPTSHRQTNSSMPNSTPPSSELASLIEPIAMRANSIATPEQILPLVQSGTTAEAIALLAMSGTTSESRPPSGIFRIFRSWIGAAGRSQKEWEVRWALRLSASYIYLLATRGSDADLGLMVNTGMLTLRDAVKNKFPKGLSLITKSWAKVILRVCRNGRSPLLEKELGLCTQDVKILHREGRIADAGNLVVAGFELLIQVCRLGDQDLIEIVARVWARAVDDSMVNTFGDQILEILAAFSERWVTAAEERNTVELRALAKAAVELLLAAGRSPFTNLTKPFAAIILSRVEQVFDRGDRILQGWVIKKLIGWPINVTIGSEDKEWAQLAVAIGMELFLVSAQLSRGKTYHAQRKKLLHSSTTVLEEIVRAGHLEDTKTAIENLANKKFSEILDVASDVRQGELQTNMREILIAVSNAGNSIPHLTTTIDDIMITIGSYPAIQVPLLT